MVVREITAKGIVTKSNLPAADFVVNPYGGCSHGCIYCYARFMKRFSGHEEPWGSYVDVKTNAALLASKGASLAGKRVFMSSVTDPYLHLEKKYALTRSILMSLLPRGPSLGVQTKSALITRDLDILYRFPSCEAGLTITTLDDSIRKETEPFASPIADRIAALERLRAAGILTYVFVGPIIPGVTDWRAVVEATARLADFYYFENLNIRGSIGQGMRSWLSSRHRDILPAFERAYAPGSDYWDRMESEIRGYCSAAGIDGRVFFHHGAR